MDMTIERRKPAAIPTPTDPQKEYSQPKYSKYDIVTEDEKILQPGRLETWNRLSIAMADALKACASL
jgi:hypothetical protein